MPNLREICVCGRGYVHCKLCGRRNPYYQKYRSLDLSVIKGVEIKAYRCQCGAQFSSEDECVAPKLSTHLEVNNTIQAGTPEYLAALNEYAVGLTKKKGMTLVKAYVEAVRNGWSLQGIEIDEQIREALELAGLVGAEPEVAPQTGGGRAAESVQTGTQAPIKGSVGLDEIIQRMQEESK